MSLCFGLRFRLPVLIAMALLALFLLVAGVYVLVEGDKIVDGEYRKALVLTPGSESFKSWQKLPAPLYSSMYFFDLKNEDEVSANRSKPAYRQAGPYVYEERHFNNGVDRKAKAACAEREDHLDHQDPESRSGFSDDMTKLTYNLTRKWKFLRENSSGDDTDSVHTVDPILAGLNGFALDQRHNRPDLEPASTTAAGAAATAAAAAVRQQTITPSASSAEVTISAGTTPKLTEAPEVTTSETTTKITTIDTPAKTTTADNACPVGPNRPPGNFGDKTPYQKWKLASDLFEFAAMDLHQDVKPSYFFNKTIRELTFVGYDIAEHEGLKDMLGLLKVDPGIPSWYGYHYSKEQPQSDSSLRTSTGVDDISKVNAVDAWYCKYCHENGTIRGYYDTDFTGKCSEVRGAGDLFPPYRDKTYLEFFAPDLCRPMKLTYDSSVRDSGGMEVFVYKMDRSFMANGAENPDNACYESDYKLPSGVYDTTACQPLIQPRVLYNSGARVFYSQPHFYQASEEYLDLFDNSGDYGMHPDPEKHETVFHVEPKTGLTVQLAARFQINFILGHLEQWKAMTLYPPLASYPHSTMVPVFWQELKFELPKEYRAQVWLLAGLPKMLQVAGTVFVLQAVALGLLILLHFWNVFTKDIDEVKRRSDEARNVSKKSGKRKDSVAATPPKPADNDEPKKAKRIQTEHRPKKSAH